MNSPDFANISILGYGFPQRHKAHGEFPIDCVA